MSARQDNRSNNNHDDLHDEHVSPSLDETDRSQFPIEMPYHSDTQRSDTATVRSRSIIDDIDADSVQSLQEDMKRRTPPTALALAALASQESEHHSGDTNTSQHRDQSSVLHAGGDMFPPSNRAYMVHRDFFKSSIANNNAGSHIDGVDVGHSAFASHGLHSTDEEHQKSQTPVRLSSDTLPVDFATSSFSAALRRYIGDVKPHAPSSVKSFGSNVGSDDCGGSLDVETHSIGARSNHSQEDILPINMPDPDPETVAVASLSIDAVVENGELRSSFGSIYRSICARQQHDRYMHLPLQRFHNNQVQFENFDDGGDFEHSARNDPLSFSPRQNHRTPLNWNDPRIDDDPSELLRREKDNSTRNKPRDRSRSRSPPS